MSDRENDTAATPSEVSKPQQTGTSQAAERSWDASAGKGGKSAVLADLVRERRIRQALQREVMELTKFKNDLANFLVRGEKAVDPAELVQRLQEVRDDIIAR